MYCCHDGKSAYLLEESIKARTIFLIQVLDKTNRPDSTMDHRELPQYPSSKASNAKFEPTVLLALLPIHLPISGPSTLYLVPNGTLCSPFIRNACVVSMTVF